jgi:hypothetical protein
VSGPISPNLAADGSRRSGPAEAIPSGQLWPLEFLHTRCGYGARARAATINAGLPVYLWQKRKWFLTDEFIALVRREGLSRDQGEAAAEGITDSLLYGNGCGKAKTHHEKGPDGEQPAGQEEI